jgi:hypothetical protein
MNEIKASAVVINQTIIQALQNLDLLSQTEDTITEARNSFARSAKNIGDIEFPLRAKGVIAVLRRNESNGMTSANIAQALGLTSSLGKLTDSSVGVLTKMISMGILKKSRAQGKLLYNLTDISPNGITDQLDDVDLEVNTAGVRNLSEQETDTTELTALDRRILSELSNCNPITIYKLSTVLDCNHEVIALRLLKLVNSDIGVQKFMPKSGSIIHYTYTPTTPDKPTALNH